MSFTVRALNGVVFLAGIALLFAGCSGGNPPTAPVSGKVTYNGEAVTSGIISFSPIVSTGAAGKAATGVVQSDGSYKLTTYQKDDGAVLGKHRVLYTEGGATLTEEDAAAAGASDEHEQEPSESPYRGLIPKVREVEVAAGPNEINIELVSAAGDSGGE